MSTPTPPTIGPRIRTLREHAGYSQSFVAKELGISQPALSQLEQGKRDVSSTELWQLADLFGVEWGAFFNEKEPTERGVVVQLRGTADEEARKIALWVQKRMHAYDALRTDLGEHYTDEYFAYRHGAGVPEYAVNHRQSATPKLLHLAREAVRERRGALGLGTAPIGDLWKVLDGDNVFVVRYLPEDGSSPDIAGLFLYEQEKNRAVIVVNGADPEERQYFTGAHEYGHFLDRSSAQFALRTDGSPTVTADRSGTIDRSSKDPHERFADFFAKEFLVPADALRFFVARVEGDETRNVLLETAVRAQVHFGVSRPCILWRLFNERLLTEKNRAQYEQDPQWRTVLRTLRPKRSALHSSAFPDRFVEVLLKAHERELISRGKFAKLLGCDPFTADDLLFNFYESNDTDRP